MKKIALFASGSGSNVENIINYSIQHKTYNPYIIFCNNPKALVIERAKRLSIPCIVFDKSLSKDSNWLTQQCINNNIDFIVLAGYLWLIPPSLIAEYPNKIINIHPALLPSYGGKGMYGKHVHEMIINNKENESGISIHFVSEEYDKGDLIFQSKCIISPDDTPDTLAAKVHDLEYKYYPEVISKIVSGN